MWQSGSARYYDSRMSWRTRLSEFLVRALSSVSPAFRKFYELSRPTSKDVLSFFFQVSSIAIIIGCLMRAMVGTTSPCRSQRIAKEELHEDQGHLAARPGCSSPHQ